MRHRTDRIGIEGPLSSATILIVHCSFTRVRADIAALILGVGIPLFAEGMSEEALDLLSRRQH